MTDLAGLLERVKAATGPDDDGSNPDWRMRKRALDADIWGLGHEVVWDGLAYYEPAPEQSWVIVPHVTASIDAALALTERVLPGGVDAVLKLQTGGKYFHAELETEEGDETAFNHPSLPLAILAAMLSAIIAQEPTP